MIVNAQQYILPDVLAELTALFLFLIMILWLLCTAEMVFFFFFISAAKCHCNRAYWSHELARRAKEMSL